MSDVGQDCILQAGFSTGLLALSSPVRRAPMKSTLQLAKLPRKAAPQAQPTSSASGGQRLVSTLFTVEHALACSSQGDHPEFG